MPGCEAVVQPKDGDFARRRVGQEYCVFDCAQCADKPRVGRVRGVERHAALRGVADAVFMGICDCERDQLQRKVQRAHHAKCIAIDELCEEPVFDHDVLDRV